MSGFCVVAVFFFFKQKTAYEMRISDWSSDVCSSDLRGAADDGAIDRGWPDPRHLRHAQSRQAAPSGAISALGQDAHRYSASLSISRSAVEQPFQNQPFIEWGCFEVAVVSKSSPESSPGKMAAKRLLEALDRSEEHTSEHKSLMS